MSNPPGPSQQIFGTAMSNRLLEKCLKKGIRMTSQRQVIVGVIGDSEDHPDVDELYRRAVDEEADAVRVVPEVLAYVAYQVEGALRREAGGGWVGTGRAVGRCEKS